MKQKSSYQIYQAICSWSGGYVVDIVTYYSGLLHNATRAGFSVSRHHQKDVPSLLFKLLHQCYNFGNPRLQSLAFSQKTINKLVKTSTIKAQNWVRYPCRCRYPYRYQNPPVDI